MSNSVPPFSLNRPRYDPNTFWGRYLNMLNVIDPRTLFVSQKQLEEATQLLKDWKEGKRPDVDDETLWQAKKIRDAIKHPDTGLNIPMPFRMSGFVPFGVPVVVGLLLPNPSVPSSLFWQWLNQTHNAAVNYCNRPIDPTNPAQEIPKLVQAYVGAVTTAMGASWGLGRLAQRSSPVLQRLVPFAAVATANVSNIFLMRRHELTEGIQLKDSDGKVVGNSQIAAQKALFDTSITRVVLPFPVLVIPPIIMAALDRTKFLQKNTWAKLPIQTLVCTAAFGFALPLAISLFPQTGTIKSSAVEPKFGNLQDKQGNQVEFFTYNKGL